MKKTIIFTLLICFGILEVKATQQAPDILLYNNDTLYVDVGWGHPSPLQTYFSQHNIPYPFTMLHTANYRGHVAVWEFNNDHFFLTEIQIGKKSHAPSEFVKAYPANSKGHIAADWFTGYVLSRKYDENDGYDIQYEHYQYIKGGQLAKEATFTPSDYEKIQKEVEKGKDLIEIENIEVLLGYEKYVAYYFRLHDDEEITISEKLGYISGPGNGKLVLSYFNNDHFKWPYNWESENKSGVPIGNWKVVENEIYLTSITLHSGLDFYETEKNEIEISDLFRGKSNPLKADWLNGFYLIQHRKEKKDKDELDFLEYEISSSRILHIKDGEILKQCEVEGDILYQEIDPDSSKETKELVKAFLNQ